MKSVIKTLALITILSGSGAVWADKGGVPNSAACGPGNAVFCSEVGVPEISIAGLPVALGLAATLILLIRERKRNR